MSKLPDKITVEFTTNEGHTYARPESDILGDMVDAVNDIIEYLKRKAL